MSANLEIVDKRVQKPRYNSRVLQQQIFFWSKQKRKNKTKHTHAQPKNKNVRAKSCCLFSHSPHDGGTGDALERWAGLSSMAHNDYLHTRRDTRRRCSFWFWFLFFVPRKRGRFGVGPLFQRWKKKEHHRIVELSHSVCGFENKYYASGWPVPVWTPRNWLFNFFLKQIYKKWKERENKKNECRDEKNNTQSERKMLRKL